MTVTNKGLGNDVEVTVSAGASTVINFDGVVVDNDGKTIAAPHVIDCWLTSDATGATLNTVSSGNFTIQTSAATLLYPTSATTSLHITVLTLADGTFGLQVTDTSPETLAYFCCTVPGSDRVSITQFASTEFGA
jgi:hypothetical protein